MSRMYHKTPSMAPDYSGAASVLHDMGGITVFCGVGGCFGNYAAFDEPRMGFVKKNFTMGFRESELVMGLDRVVKEKVCASFQRLGGKFVALVGTPTSTLIGTDFQGICREIEKEIGVPVFCADTSGLFSYESGQEKIYSALMDYAMGISVREPADVHIIGATPLDAWDYGQQDQLRELLRRCGARRPLIWGDGDTLETLGDLDRSRLNIAVSVSGIRIVQRLHQAYGTPYRIGFPVGRQALSQWETDLKKLLSGEDGEKPECQQKAEGPLTGKRVLIVGEQVASNMLRQMLRQEFGCTEADVASFFAMDKELMEDGDFFAETESGYLETLRARAAYDVVMGDDFLTRPVPYPAQAVRIPSLAISGLVFIRQSPVLFGETGSLFFEQYANPSQAENTENEESVC